MSNTNIIFLLVGCLFLLVFIWKGIRAKKHEKIEATQENHITSIPSEITINFVIKKDKEEEAKP